MFVLRPENVTYGLVAAVDVRHVYARQAEEEADGVPDADKEVLREAATEETEDNSLLNVDTVTQYEVLDEDWFNEDIEWVHEGEVNTRVEETDHSEVHLRLTTVTVRLRLPTWKHK